jgi:hypothetical protein
MAKRGVTSPRISPAQLEKKLRRAVRAKYPALEEALDELAASGLYGDSKTFLEAFIEAARACFMELWQNNSPFVRATAAAMQRRMEAHASKPQRKKEKRRRRR